jgi:hypothetical protein
MKRRNFFKRFLALPLVAVGGEEEEKKEENPHFWFKEIMGGELYEHWCEVLEKRFELSRYPRFIRLRASEPCPHCGLFFPGKKK